MQTKPNNYSENEAVQALKKSIYRRAFLALFLIVLTVVMLFAVTTAWYSNVARTSELMFQVATWGFNGEIWVDESPIVAGPGDEGGVYLTLQNESDSAVDASVYVDKSKLVDDMQKRLFFYVETSAVSEGETVDKVYINSRNGFDYSIMGKGNLTLTPSYQNDAEIRWEWVYDMLGYYVWGKLDTDISYTSLETDAKPINEGNTVSVQEYLRPIEYAYDEATTEFEDPVTVGEQQIEFVKSINGVSLNTFLSELTAKDGYSGTVNSSTARTPDGFYPVSIDAATGEGVWLYLCNYADIESGIAFDTTQGKTALDNLKQGITAKSMNVTLNITAEKSDAEATQVGTATDLVRYLTSADDVAIKLTQDVQLSETLNIATGKKAMVDLNGKTLTYTGLNTMIKGEIGSSVVFTNGAIVGNESVAFATSGSELVLSDVDASGLSYLVAVMDDEAGSADSRVQILGCNATVSTCGVFIKGNGDQSSNYTQVVMEGCKINAGYAGIMANGTEAYSGTDITVNNCVITGKYAAIYHPQKDSVLTVQHCELSGMTGVVIKGGTVKLSSSIITGTGVATEPVDSLEASGWTDTGDGIYVCGIYDYFIDVQISNCDVSTADVNAFAIRSYDADANNVFVTVHSGTFSSDVGEYVPTTSTQDTSSSSQYVVTVNQ